MKAIAIILTAAFIVAVYSENYTDNSENIIASSNIFIEDEPEEKCRHHEERRCAPPLRKDCWNKFLWPIIFDPPRCILKSCVCVDGYVKATLFNRTCIRADQCS
ncbi:uncharacterized protein LOC132698440 isoform X1 [Cylas formicarius]|uniref:uncharacterized protein LOC132698440 isoform X1 n=1 Tax=Cylas formicarius TaxID=197179 RepID=UPI0029584086|nr:uncharacterized protein LOC132698440 isoform X1 [Cylas formicarius]